MVRGVGKVLCRLAREPRGRRPVLRSLVLRAASRPEFPIAASLSHTRLWHDVRRCGSIATPMAEGFMRRVGTACLGLLLLTTVVWGREAIDPNQLPPKPEPTCTVIVSSTGPIVICR